MTDRQGTVVRPVHNAPRGRHAIFTYQRVKRWDWDRGRVYLTCECGALASYPTDAPEAEDWWAAHAPGHVR